MSQQQITTRLVLDAQRPYFPGESILGKVMLACPRSITPHAIRLIWAGGVTIRPSLQDHENHIYFKRNYAINNDKLNGRKIGNGVAYKSSAFVENHDTTQPLDLTLEQSVTYSFAFEVQVPPDIPLPSSTEVTMLGGKIVYTVESCIDFVKDDPEPTRSHVMVTVLEHMDVRLPELAVPRSEESVCSLWLPHTPLASPCNYRTAMRATIPCQASTRGGQAEIVIHVWHSVEHQELKGVKVSLLRIRQLHFNGSVYAFPDETVISMRADVDLKQDKNFMQTLRCHLPIRDDLTPSISDSAKLLEVSYKIQIKVQLQKGTYQSLDGDSKGYMAVELPFLIGTVPLMIGKRTITPPPQRKKSILSGTSTSGSKKSSSDNDNGSMLSAESSTNNQEINCPIERTVSKNKSKAGKKIDTLRDMLRFPGSSKSNKQKEIPPPSASITTTDSSTQSSESILSRSRTSSTKNTDQEDSTTSPSASSPTTTIQAQQTSVFDPRNIRPTNTYTYSPDEEITTSPYELKPDEKDEDEYFDTERLAAINKSKADAIATASIVSPIDGTKLLPPPLPPRMASLPSSTVVEDAFVKDDDDSISKPTPMDDIPKKTHHVHYHDIFGSSGEEDSEDDNDKDVGDGARGHCIEVEGDNDTMTITTTLNKPAEEKNDDERYGGSGKASLPRLNQLPSPPMDETEYNKVHGYESDGSSSGDDSPVAVMSKQARRHKYIW